MSTAEAVRRLQELGHTFGPGPARSKARLLRRIAGAERIAGSDRAVLEGIIEFLRAYPDNPVVSRLTGIVARRLPSPAIVHDFSYGVVRRLVREVPDKVAIDWEELENESALVELLDLLVAPGESDGATESSIPLSDWFANAKPGGFSDLRYLVDLLESSGLPDRVRVHLFESCQLPVLYRGPDRPEITLPGSPVHYQRRPLERERFPLEPLIRRPLRRIVRGGRPLLRLALEALCARTLEIYPLIHADPRDITVADGGRGIRTLLAGMEPEWRSPFESIFFFLLFKNGVPVAYGPASVLGGCCEMGINLFPEFRGGEIRRLYGELMRVLHQRLGADYFFLTRYGMGEGNEEAIRTGAFWFYRKLGFVPTQARVEALARQEEARRAADPGYRSDRRMLRRLSATEVYLDLSGGRRRPVDLVRLSLAESRSLSRVPPDRKDRFITRCATRLGRFLGADPRARAVRSAAPTLRLIEDLRSWKPREREALARFLKAKDAPSESAAARAGSRHARLIEALHRISRD